MVSFFCDFLHATECVYVPAYGEVDACHIVVVSLLLLVHISISFHHALLEFQLSISQLIETW